LTKEDEKMIIKNEKDDKEDEELKMSDDIIKICEKGPLRELKKKINSSNINSRTGV